MNNRGKEISNLEILKKHLIYLPNIYQNIYQHEIKYMHGKKLKYKDIVLDLFARQGEEERFESKENWFEPKPLGEYISALSNVAAIFRKRNGL